MLNALKTLLPYRLRYWLYRQRLARESQRADRRLSAMNVGLGEEHVCNARLVPDRLAMLRLLPQGMVAVEVGVAQGEFSEQIRSVLRPRKLVLIDSWTGANPMYSEDAYRAVTHRFRDGIEAGDVVVKRALSWDGLADLPPASVDFIYIDAAHDYDSVKRDLEAARRAIRDEGVIAGHDYTRWGGAARYGVVEAVNEFVIGQGFEFLCLTSEPDRHCSFAIRQIRERTRPQKRFPL